MIRLFAALAVPFDACEALAELQTGVEGARWRPAEALHITLRFFGEMQETKAEDLDSELARISSPPIDIAIHGAGCFGEAEWIDAIWAGVEENAALRVLAGRCEAAARRAGLKAETRVYHPHVTLAYLRRPGPAGVPAWIQRHNLFKAKPFRAQVFGLYSSRLGHGGSRYELERVYQLR